MALVVMAIIIILNIFLVIVLIRVGTQGEHHTELSPDQSSAVVALRARLGIPPPEPKGVAVVQEHAKDVEHTVEDVAEDVAESVEDTVDDVIPDDRDDDNSDTDTDED